MHTVDFLAGTHITKAAAELVAAAKVHGAAKGTFNDIELTADAGSSPEAIVARFDADSASRAEAYRNSPEGKAAERASDERRASAQAKHDALMARLPSLGLVE